MEWFSSSGADVARSAGDTDGWCRLLGVSTRDAGCRLRKGGRGSGGWKGGVLIERAGRRELSIEPLAGYVSSGECSIGSLASFVSSAPQLHGTQSDWVHRAIVPSCLKS